MISKKSQNKAAKRVSESSDDLKEDFAVPNVPLRRKRNQSMLWCDVVLSFITRRYFSAWPTMRYDTVLGFG